jgi:hypothetical protein
MSPELNSLLLHEIEKILRSNPDRMFSKEEILNLLSHFMKDFELEQILATLEIASSAREKSSDITAKCKGGTVYYRWNR